jgi:PAS domain S-box-containing protein
VGAPPWVDRALAAAARVAQADSRDALLEATVTALHEVARAERIVIALEDRPGGSIEPSVAYESGQAVPPWTLRHVVAPLAQQAITRGSAVASGGAVAVPLLGPTQRLGVLYVAAGGAIAEGGDLLRHWLALIATQLAHGLESWRRGVRLAAERRLTDAGAELARIALEASDPQAVTGGVGRHARRILQLVGRLVPHSALILSVARQDGEVIECLAATGTAQGLDGRRYPRGRSAAADSVRAGLPTRLEDLRAAVNPAVMQWTPAEPAFAMPLFVAGRQHGVLIACRPADGTAEPPEWSLLERLAPSVAVAVDVLERAADARVLRERERLLALALATMEHPVFVLEGDMIRYANRAAERVYGMPAHELARLPFSARVVRRIDRAELVEPGATAVASDATAGEGAHEEIHRRADGTEFPVVVSSSVLRPADAGPAGRVVSVRDISGERRVAEHLRETEKMIALGELVGGVAHEINNPLTGISALAQLLLEEPLTEEHADSVRLIKREVDRAKTVVQDLQLFARASEGTAVDLSINELVEETLRLRSYRLRQAGVEIVLLLDPSAPRLRGDAPRLKQMLLHFVVNAEDAMKSTTRRRLTVRTGRHGDRVRVTIADTGTGMSAEVRRRAFEPFFSTKPSGQGTGLGLSIAFGIVQAHGGRLVLESTPDAGTSVELLFAVAGAPPLLT